jgi:hypothetical protein
MVVFNEYTECFKIILTKFNGVFYITKVVKMFTQSYVRKRFLYESDHLLVCNLPSVRICPAIHPECYPTATVFVDTAVPSTYSYHRVRGPLEVNLT